MATGRQEQAKAEHSIVPQEQALLNEAKANAALRMTGPRVKLMATAHQEQAREKALTVLQE
jgi:hypothetical protein